jgi:hypothetical protein
MQRLVPASTAMVVALVADVLSSGSAHAIFDGESRR